MQMPMVDDLVNIPSPVDSTHEVLWRFLETRRQAATYLLLLGTEIQNRVKDLRHSGVVEYPWKIVPELGPGMFPDSAELPSQGHLVISWSPQGLWSVNLTSPDLGLLPAVADLRQSNSVSETRTISESSARCTQYDIQ